MIYTKKNECFTLIDERKKNCMRQGIKRSVFLFISFITLASGLYAQSEFEFPGGNFWSLSAGIGMSNILISGPSYQVVFEPKLWLSPPLMVGSKVGINFSNEENNHNILTFEGQVYLRWNFLRLGRRRTTNIFVQGGLGLLAAYRGDANPFDDVTMTRGSVLADAAIGVTIPLSSRVHIEPSVRGGYPHLWGVSLTAGYKFPLPKNNNNIIRTEYVEIIRTIPASEIVKRVMITAVEFILFGPDIGSFNIGVDSDAQQLNVLVLNQTAEILKGNSSLRVRIEGHVNPYTIAQYEVEEIMALSAMRANAVAEQLKERGVNEEQIVVISFGGTRAATSEFDARNRNRRVELIIIQLDSD